MVRRRKQAFTLIEVLAVLVLTGLLLAAVLQLLQQAHSSQRVVRSLTERQASREAVETVVRMDLENLVRHAAVARRIVAPGQAGALLELVCLAPGPVPQADAPARPWHPARVRYLLQPGPAAAEGLVLVRQQQDLTQPASAMTAPVVVAAELERLRCTFRRGNEWLDRWPPAEQPEAVPEAVRIAWQASGQAEEQVVVRLR